MEYKELSRRGLIHLNEDYDKSTDGALKSFLGENEAGYEEVRPYDLIGDRMDELTSTLEDKADIVSKNLLARANKAFDGLIDALTGEFDRTEAVLEEQEEDEAYPDDVEITEF